MLESRASDTAGVEPQSRFTVSVSRAHSDRWICSPVPISTAATRGRRSWGMCVGRVRRNDRY